MSLQHAHPRDFIKRPQLPAVVGAERHIRIRADKRAGAQARRVRGGHRVGQIIFALRVFGRQPFQSFGKERGVKPIGPGVDFANSALRFIGIPLLNDRSDSAVFAADDAPIAERVVQTRRQKSDGVFLRAVHV